MYSMRRPAPDQVRISGREKTVKEYCSRLKDKKGAWGRISPGPSLFDGSLVLFNQEVSLVSSQDYLVHR